MKIETILNAMHFAHTQARNLYILERLDPYFELHILLGRRERQVNFIHDRIIRMDEEKDVALETLWIDIEIVKHENEKLQEMYRECISGWSDTGRELDLYLEGR